MVAASITNSVPSAAAVLIGGTFVALLLADLVAGIAVGAGSSSLRRSPQDRGSLQVILVTTFGGVTLGVQAASHLIGLRLPGDVWIWVSAGLAFAWAGIALRVWAILTLGSSFRRVVTVTPDQKVVTNGPYRFVRHPSYSALVLAWGGLGLALHNWLALASLLLLPASGFVYRILVEERALRASLGDRYRAYAEGRPRLVPGIW